MSDPSRTQKIPGPDHPITLAPADKKLRVIFRGQTIAESAAALVMQEASYSPVFYFPRNDVKMAMLARTQHNSWCPYKGEASYFTMLAEDGREENSVWSYETPFEPVGGIRELLAFYPNKIDRIEEF